MHQQGKGREIELRVGGVTRSLAPDTVTFILEANRKRPARHHAAPRSASTQGGQRYLVTHQRTRRGEGRKEGVGGQREGK